MVKHSFFLLLIIGILFGCGTTEKLSDNNISSIYRTGNEIVVPQFTVFHKSIDTTEIYFKINTKNLLYSQTSSTNQFEGKIKIAYYLYKAFESNEMVDSASTVIVDVIREHKIKSILGTLKVNAKFPNDYVLHVVTTDLTRQQSTDEYIPIIKSDKNNAQNFLILDQSNNQPTFKNYFEKGETVSVLYNNPDNLAALTFRYYQREFEVAPPPFSIYNREQFDYTPNKESKITLTDNKFEWTIDGRGIYHFLPDPNERDGLSLFQYANGFPKVNEISEMISALRFITSKREFTNIKKDKNQKKALDEFWLKVANSKPRARELIKTYYNRLQNANLFFSSHREGWKSDRGVIYLVFGPPDVVYKSSTGESWIYGEENNYLSVTFNFVKVKNPFSINDFELSRSPVYKNQWYRAVDSWRQGRVSSLDY